MANFTLTAQPILKAEQKVVGTITLTPEPMSLICIVAPNGDTKALAAILKKELALALPDGIRLSESSGGEFTLLPMAPNQFFLMFAEEREAEQRIRQTLGDAAYCTDQSDAWVAVRIQGEDVLSMLERICAHDLDESAFPVGGVVRTVIEHSGVTLIRNGSTDFTLMSASSFGQSFYENLVMSAEYVA